MRGCKLIRFCAVVALLLCVVAFSARVRAEEPYKNGVKITFLSWSTGSTKISYERAFPALKQSAEICSSLISAGYQHCFGHFVVDGWVGGGYAFGKASETGYHHGFQL